MRVLFIYPNLYTQMGFNHGLASLSAVLKEAGHETRLLNLNEKLPPVPTRDDIYQTVKDWNPGMIGFSCLTMQYDEAVKIATFLRTSARTHGFELPPMVVGGIHPTMVPEKVMADGVWDYVGVGECENALIELTACLEKGERPVELQNFLAWKDGRIPDTEAGEEPKEEKWVRTNVGEFPDVTQLPEPDYDLFDIQRITAQKQGWFGLMTSRGCPYRCTYCLNHKVVDLYKKALNRPTAALGFLRYRPADKMIAEIRGVLERYEGITTLILDDDLFTMNPQHAIDFCEAYAAAKIDMPFVVNSHVKRLDPRVAEGLAKAGCRILKVGIESGSPRVRTEVLQRHMSQKDIMQTAASAEKYRLHTSGFVMVGLPSETMAELWETVDTLAEARIGRFRTSFFYPFPGTEGYELAVNGGYVPADLNRSMSTFTDGSILDFGPEQNLLVDKLGTAMPWFVNSRLAHFHPESEASAVYAPIVERVLAMNRSEWMAFKWKVRAMDRELSQGCVERGELHYAVRYNTFMGVRSDYFLAEDVGQEWFTAAAKPVGKRLQDLAVAASEMA